MKINKFVPFSDLVTGLKEVPMLTNKTKQPYKDARFQLINFNPRDLNPTSLYFIESNLAVQRQIRAKLLELGHDTFKLWWLLSYEWDDWKTYNIMPPVVEAGVRRIQFEPRPGEIAYESYFPVKIPILLDWLHRSLLALQLDNEIEVIYVNNIDPECPSYALPNTWDEVKWHSQAPTENSLKKRYISTNPKDFYKDFSWLVNSEFRWK